MQKNFVLISNNLKAIEKYQGHPAMDVLDLSGESFLDVLT